MVSPVIRSLVYDSIPKSCIDFILRIERDWRFKRILPCHLAGPIKARNGDLIQAFRFSFEALGQKPPSQIPFLDGFFGGRNDRKARVMQKDNRTLDALIDFLRRLGVLYEQRE